MRAADATRRSGAAAAAAGPGETDRREFLKLLGLGGTLPLLEPGLLHAAPPRAPGEDAQEPRSIYERLLGVRPVINAAGPLTSVGGSVMPREVVDALAEASRHFVDLDQLNAAAGARLAAITGAEAAMVTSGAFGGMVLAAAACLAGSDTERMAALPHPTWPRRELVIQRAQQFVYDHAYTNAGMTIVAVDTAEEMLAAIGERTAMIAGIANVEKWNRPGVILPERLIEIGRRTGVPVFLDAAGEVPPVSNLQRYTRMGADLVTFSGGKGLRGPGSTGILAGRTDLIASARAQTSPHSGIGRGMKVDKEEIVGLLVAVERFLRLDHDAELRRQRARAGVIRDRLAGVAGLRLGADDSMGPGVVLAWDEDDIPISYREFGQRMREGEPPIAVWTFRLLAYSGEPTLFTASLEDGQETVVGERAREVLLAAKAG
jgi:L-seryl-tRNA(Ser) seleniumtransferase